MKLKFAVLIGMVVALVGACGCQPVPPGPTSPSVTTKKPAPPTTKKPAPPTTKKPAPPIIKTPVPVSNNVDVLVAGSGPGAVAAAVAASRQGSRTQIVTHDANVLGGQVQSVGRIDVVGDDSKWGPYKEFIARAKVIGPAMGFSATEIGKGWMPPELTELTLANWMADEGVSVVRDRITGVVRSGITVQGLKLASGKTMMAKVTVDGTEWGDVLADSGLPFMLGNGRSDRGDINPNECLQDATWPVNLSTKSTVKVNRSVFPPVPLWPHNYDGDPWNNAERHANYREVAAVGSERRTQVNHQSSDVPTKVRDATTGRNAMETRAARKAMQYVGTLQALPDGGVWGLDVGRSNANVAPLSAINVAHKSALTSLPYVREGRRGVGVRILDSAATARVKIPDIPGYQDATQERTSIGVGNYSADLHECWPVNGDPSESDQSMIPDVGNNLKSQAGPYSIPFEAIVPNRGAGFVFAEKNISVTRSVNGATRIHPAAFTTGAASGTIAALAVRNNVAPRNVNVEQVQWILASDWKSDLTNRRWEDSRPGTAEQSFFEFAVARGWSGGVKPNVIGHGWRVRRGDAITFLAKAKGLSPSAFPVFSDTHGEQGRWLAAAKADGWFNGCGTTTACPDKFLTKTELGYLVARIPGGVKPSGTGDATSGDIAQFSAGVLDRRYMG